MNLLLAIKMSIVELVPVPSKPIVRLENDAFELHTCSVPLVRVIDFVEVVDCSSTNTNTYQKDTCTVIEGSKSSGLNVMVS